MRYILTQVLLNPVRTVALKLALFFRQMQVRIGIVMDTGLKLLKRKNKNKQEKQKSWKSTTKENLGEKEMKRRRMVYSGDDEGYSDYTKEEIEWYEKRLTDD